MSVRLQPHLYSSGLRKIVNSDGIISWEFYFTIESPWDVVYYKIKWILWLAQVST